MTVGGHPLGLTWIMVAGPCCIAQDRPDRATISGDGLQAALPHNAATILDDCLAEMLTIRFFGSSPVIAISPVPPPVAAISEIVDAHCPLRTLVASLFMTLVASLFMAHDTIPARTDAQRS